MQENGSRSRSSSGMCSALTPNFAFQGGIRCAMPPHHGGSMGVRQRGVVELLQRVFSSPPSFLLGNRASHCKNKIKKYVYLFVKLNYILIFFYYCNVIGLESFIKLICFFNFIS